MENISIVMINKESPVFEAAYQSILANKVPFEFVLVDNGSSQEYKNIYEQLGLNYHEHNTGTFAGARQKGLEVATGTIIITVDSTKIYAPDFVQHMVATLEEGYDLVYAKYQHQYRGLYIFAQPFIEFFRKLWRKKRSAHVNIMGGAMCFRKSTAMAVNGYFHFDGHELIGRGEDGLLAKKIMDKGGSVKRSEKAIVYSKTIG
jgi:glycosyltransferase involved in cell wall biosynthesis